MGDNWNTSDAYVDQFGVYDVEDPYAYSYEGDVATVEDVSFFQEGVSSIQAPYAYQQDVSSIEDPYGMQQREDNVRTDIAILAVLLMIICLLSSLVFVSVTVHVFTGGGYTSETDDDDGVGRGPSSPGGSPSSADTTTETTTIDVTATGLTTASGKATGGARMSTRGGSMTTRGGRMSTRGGRVTTGGTVSSPVATTTPSASSLKPFSTPCNVTLTAPTGAIGSPGFPNAYPNNLHMTWCIRAPPGQHITVNFHSADFEGDCNKDSLFVYDDGGPQPVVLRKLCGRYPVSATTSHSNMVYLIMRTDDNIRGGGFYVTYYFTTITNVLLALPRSAKPLSSRGRDGEWLVEAEEGRVLLNFSAFDLDECCDCEYLRVFDGANTSAPVLGRYCGKRAPADITSTSQAVLLQFHSVSDRTSKGFNVTYIAV